MIILTTIIIALLVNLGSQVTFETIKNLYEYCLHRRIDIDKFFFELFEEKLCSSFEKTNKNIKSTLKLNKEKILNVVGLSDIKNYNKILIAIKTNIFYQNLAKECSIILDLTQQQDIIEKILINIFDDLRKKILEKIPKRILEILKIQELENIGNTLQKMFIDTERLDELKNRYMNSLYNHFKTHFFYGLSSPGKLLNCELEELFVIPIFNLMERTLFLEPFFKTINSIFEPLFKNFRNYSYIKELNEITLTPEDLKKKYFLSFFKEDKNFAYSFIKFQNNLLLSGKKLIILGNPGCGKSTYMKFLVLINSNEKLSLKYREIVINKCPIFIELGEYAKTKKQKKEKTEAYYIIDFIVEKILKKFLESIEIKTIQDLTKNLLDDEGDCLIIFDGYDEILDIKLQIEIREEINLFISIYNKNLYIITSRKVGYEEVKFIGEDFVYFELKEFTIGQKEDLITKFFIAFKRKDLTNNLKDVLRKNEKINDLASNPLMLTIMCFMTLSGLNISQIYRWELLKNCTDTFLDTWIDFKGLEKRNTQIIMRELGYWFHTLLDTHTIESITVNKSNLVNKLIELFKKLPQYENAEIEIIKKDIDDLLRYMKITNGFLIEQDEFKFSHLLIQEFFAASYIYNSYADVKDIWKIIKKKIPLIHWREVLILLMGMVSENDQRIQKLIMKIINYYMYSKEKNLDYLFFIISLLCEKISLNPDLRDKVLFEILNSQTIYKSIFKEVESSNYEFNETNLSLYENYLEIYPNDINFILKIFEKDLDNEFYLICVFYLLFHNVTQLINSDCELIILKWMIKYGLTSKYETIKKISNLTLFIYGNSEEIKLSENYINIILYVFKNFKIDDWKFFTSVDFEKFKFRFIMQWHASYEMWFNVIRNSLLLLNQYSKDLDKLNEYFNFLDITKLNKIIDDNFLPSNTHSIIQENRTPTFWLIVRNSLFYLEKENLLFVYENLSRFTPSVISYLVRIILINIFFKELHKIPEKNITSEISIIKSYIPKGVDTKFIFEFEKALTAYQEMYAKIRMFTI